MRTNLGAIGVVSARYQPTIEVETPGKGKSEGAEEEAWGWTRDWVHSALTLRPVSEVSVLISLTMLALTPLVAVGGAVHGVVDAEDPEDINPKEDTIEQALAKLNFQPTFRDHVLREARALTTHPFVVVSDQGPIKPDETPTYAEWQGQGLSTAFEVRLEEVGLVGPGGVDPCILYDP